MNSDGLNVLLFGKNISYFKFTYYIPVFLLMGVNVELRFCADLPLGCACSRAAKRSESSVQLASYLDGEKVALPSAQLAAAI